MKIILILLLFVLAGCNSYPPMTREETVKAVKECKDGGLTAVIVVNTWTYETIGVHCQNDKP